MTEKDILEQIKSKGYWKIIIRPKSFKEDRISDLQLEEMVKDSQVTYRGWYYPHIYNKGDRFGYSFLSNNYFASGVEYQGHIEVWRMYKSGQFVHYLGLYEDWFPALQTSGKVLEIIMALYTVTEVFTFIKNMIRNELTNDDIELSIELNDVNDRTLWFYSVPYRPLRFLHESYQCQMDNPIKISKQIKINQILSDCESLAMETTIELFRRFNWKSTEIGQVLRKDQEDLINKTL